LLDGVENDDPNAVPINDLALSCYPNPFKNNITIQIDLKQTSVTTLKLYNIRGELVKNIYDNALPKGKSSLKWDGKNEQHVNCASGIYILKAISGSKSHAIKLIKLK
jgi:flagellar hook assembly protein FlgD